MLFLKMHKKTIHHYIITFIHIKWGKLYVAPRAFVVLFLGNLEWASTALKQASFLNFCKRHCKKTRLIGGL